MEATVPKVLSETTLAWFPVPTKNVTPQPGLAELALAYPEKS